jgi:dienelactone hydrolase
MNKFTKALLVFLLVLLGAAAYGVARVGFEESEQEIKPLKNRPESSSTSSPASHGQAEEAGQGQEAVLHPMSVVSLREQDYAGGQFTLKEELQNGSNYERYIASYESEGLNINGLLTVPLGEKPKAGFPAVVFVHGYIPPDQYSTTGSYPTYQARLARAGFVTYKPDLRGHDESEGEPVSAHFSEKYVVDTLNALAYLKEHKDVDPGRLGYWGHSNGGEIGLRVAVVSNDIQAYSFWAGVVGSYEDMLETYNNDIPFLKDAEHNLIQENGLPSENPDFWGKLDPYNYLPSISAPIQLQHATGDESVPVELSLSLRQSLESAGKAVEYIEYQGDDHNITQNSATAWERTINFFRDNLGLENPELALPLGRPEERIIKKNFGTYVTPESSPVEDEKFRGYHTGVDWEVFPEEIGNEVEVKAVCSGQLADKSYVSGYGGVAVQDCELNDEPVTVIYGHLDLASIAFGINEQIGAGQVLGALGEHKSQETDGERKHLHLGIRKGSEVNFQGYVDSEDKLSAWLDPCDYVCGD